jgi:hypothetical protein
MAVYIAFKNLKGHDVKAGSIDQVLLWAASVIGKNSVIKIARAGTEGKSLKIIADYTSEGLFYARSPRLLSKGVSKKLCQRTRK